MSAVLSCRCLIGFEDDAFAASFLDFVLSHYVSERVQELDRDKLPPQLRLKYHAINDAVADLGKPEEIDVLSLGSRSTLQTERLKTCSQARTYRQAINPPAGQSQALQKCSERETPRILNHLPQATKTGAADRNDETVKLPVGTKTPP